MVAYDITSKPQLTIENDTMGVMPSNTNGGIIMTRDEALGVTRRALAKADKAVGVIDIAPFNDDYYVVALRKWGKEFQVILTLERLTNAKADLQRGSSG